MQRGMLLVALFIVGFGLCATKRPREKPKSTKTYTRTLEMIRKDEDLRLLMFSPQITKRIPSCLISKYINKTSKGALRTLKINKIETGTKVSQLETTIRIYVNKSSPASLQVKFEGVSLPASWTEPQYLKYAKNKQCIILGSSPDKGRRPPCVLWGYNHTIKCQKRFVEKCGTGAVVDLTKCTNTKEEKGDPPFSAEKLNSTQIYTRSLKMMRTNDTLRLLMFSPKIEKKIPSCMISRYINRTNEETRRTLEINKIEKEDRKFSQLRTQVRINVINSSHPTLQLTFEGVSLPDSWTVPQYLKYAKPGQCIILGASPEEGRRSPCVLWGYNNTIYCQKTFVEKCGAGSVVDLTKCTNIGEENGSPANE